MGSAAEASRPSGRLEGTRFPAWGPEPGLLCCPRCRGGLGGVGNPEDPLGPAVLRCQGCGSEYPVRGGFPLLWLPDAECVGIWGHRFGDFVLDETTLAGWAGRTEDPETEGRLWGRLERARKRLEHPAFSLAALLLLLAIPAAVLLRSVPLLWVAGVGVITYGFLWARVWHLATEAYYCHRDNYFALQAKRVCRLHREGELSERKHYGGGEQVFLHPAVDPDVPPPPLSDLQREHDAFIARKARDLARRRWMGTLRGDAVLSVGCGGPSHQDVNRVFAGAGCRLTGLDTQDYNVVFFQHAFQAPALLANAMRIPLKDALYDGVVLTDVLEHLHDPLAGLRETHRVLKPGGWLVLTTNNRASHLYARNPVAFFRVFAGQWFPALLPAREVAQDWDGKTYLHGEFARAELKTLLRMAGFQSFSLRTACLTNPARVAALKIAASLGLGSHFVVLAHKTPSPRAAPRRPPRDLAGFH